MVRVDPKHNYSVSSKTKEILEKYKGYYFCTDWRLMYLSKNPIEDFIDCEDSEELNVEGVEIIINRRTTLKGVGAFLLGDIDELLNMLKVV